MKESTSGFRVRSLSSLNSEEYTTFPREKEGNMYIDNWSLVGDGVTSQGDAFRNARIPVLTSRLASKVESGKVELKHPKYEGSYSVIEAGDGVSHEDFGEAMNAQHEYLSTGIDLFVEDASLGAFSSSRVGVRVVSDSPAVALICRTLLVRFVSKTSKEIIDKTLSEFTLLFHFHASFFTIFIC